MDGDPHQVGFPPERISLKSLNFCDIGWGGIERNAMWTPVECPKGRGATRGTGPRAVAGPMDKTCMSCLKAASLAEGERLWQFYAEPRAAAVRQARLQQWFNASKTIIVVAANEGYLKLLKAWLCHAIGQKLGVTPRNLLVFAFDDAVYQWAQKKGLRAMRPEDYSIKVPETIASEFKYSLLPLFGDILRAGHTVLFNDVDMIWKGDLGAVLDKAWPGTDIVSQLAARWDAQGPLNSGILYIRSVPQSSVAQSRGLFLPFCASVAAPEGRGMGGGGSPLFHRHSTAAAVLAPAPLRPAFPSCFPFPFSVSNRGVGLEMTCSPGAYHRPKHQTITFVETLMSTIPIFLDAFQGPSDQLMWNILLRHHKFRSLTWRPLPQGIAVNAAVRPLPFRTQHQARAGPWEAAAGPLRAGDLPPG